MTVKYNPDLKNIEDIREVFKNNCEEIPETKYILSLMDSLKEEYGEKLTLDIIIKNLLELQRVVSISYEIINFHIKEKRRVSREPH